MKLTPTEVQKIASLSKLSLTEEEIEMFSAQLSDVLTYFQKLNELNTEGVEETSQVTGLVNVYREDVFTPCADSARLVQQGHTIEDGQFKVKNVL